MCSIKCFHLFTQSFLLKPLETRLMTAESLMSCVFSVPNPLWRQKGDCHRLRQQVRDAPCYCYSIYFYFPHHLFKLFVLSGLWQLGFCLLPYTKACVCMCVYTHTYTVYDLYYTQT